MVMHVLVGGHGNVNQVGCKDAATKLHRKMKMKLFMSAQQRIYESNK